MSRKISAGVNGGPRGGSSVRRPGSEDPHRREWKFVPVAGMLFLLQEISDSDQSFLLESLFLCQEFSSSVIISFDSNKIL